MLISDPSDPAFGLGERKEKRGTEWRGILFRQTRSRARPWSVQRSVVSRRRLLTYGKRKRSKLCLLDEKEADGLLIDSKVTCSWRDDLSKRRRKVLEMQLEQMKS